MKTLIVYDSVFGNTEQIALAVADALESKGDVQTLRVSDAKPEHLDGLEWLMVGSPTRGFRPTEAITKFLNEISTRSLKGVKVAAFDTRISVAKVKSRFLSTMVRLFGYAAPPIAKKLQRKGGTLVIPPEGFIVKDTEGPLEEGELERAAQWAKQAMRTT